jgi:phosphoglycolate phosphatase-like HAD superfamily hydrolase
VAALYLEYLGEMVERVEPASYYALDGVARLLGEVQGLPSVALGLGTGNIREGARLKLARVGLFDMFAFGGFGCDHEDRSVVVRMGAERGAARLDMPLTQCRVVVIGDTPRDVEASRAIGAECIGVGTGRFSPRELLDAGADHAFPALADERVIEVLLR